jgi:uncharacterized protein YqjF (DUF2071 family)
MARPFLTAEWRNLLMANYAIDPGVLKPFVPPHTELDSFNGTCYASLVGFLFANTRLKGIPIPFHRTFEEVNLRFYVRFREGNQWKRGVVFMKEIVPKRMISFVANTFYGEKYATHTMRHNCKQSGTNLEVAYEWKVGSEWNYLRAVAEKESAAIQDGSITEFITEHYWGYTFVDPQCTGVYEVRHPRWKIHKVTDFESHCSVKALYGPRFVDALSRPPVSVFLADGSPIEVMGGTKIRGLVQQS